MKYEQSILCIATWIIFVSALLCVAFFPDNAEAFNCKSYPGLTNNIVGCVRDTLDDATTRFFVGVYPILANAITATVILSVTIFGVMTAFGMLEKVGRDSMMLLLKVAAVTYFVTSSDDIYKFTLLAMDTSAEAVVSYVPSSGPSDITPNSSFSQITCLKNISRMYGVGRIVHIKTLNLNLPSDSVSGPWLAMDCMIDSVIGIRVFDPKNLNPPSVSGEGYNQRLKGSDSGVSRGLLYLFFGAMTSSALGVFIAGLGFIYIWGILNLVIKAMFIYIAGYLGIAVLVIFAPLFIPLILFQATKAYFDQWIQMLIGLALQPIIILIFVVFSISAIDLATFSGKYSIMYAVAGNESQQPEFSLNEYLSRERGYGKLIIDDRALVYGRVKTDSLSEVELANKTADTFIQGLDNSKCTKALMAADPKVKEVCDDSYPLQMFRQALNWDLLARARIPAVVVPAGSTAEQQITREVMASLIFAAMVVFVMSQMLTIIPKVATDLVGSLGVSADLSDAGGSLPGQDKIKQSMASIVSKRAGGGN